MESVHANINNPRDNTVSLRFYRDSVGIEGFISSLSVQSVKYSTFCKADSSPFPVLCRKKLKERISCFQLHHFGFIFL